MAQKQTTIERIESCLNVLRLIQQVAVKGDEADKIRHIATITLRSELGLPIEEAPKAVPGGWHQKPPEKAHEFSEKAYGKDCTKCGAPISMDLNAEGKWRPYEEDGTEHVCKK